MFEVTVTSSTSRRGGRLGSSKILAALFLLLTVAGASVIVYVWYSSLAGEAASQASEESVASKMLKIEGAQVEGDKVLLYVRNIGEEDAVVDVVYMLSPAGNVIAAASPEGGPVEIPPGEVTLVTVQIPENVTGSLVLSLSERGGTHAVLKLEEKVLKSSQVSKASEGKSEAKGGEEKAKKEKPWLSGWQFRRKIEVYEQSGKSLTNYPVKIVLDTSNFDFSKAKPGGGDLRFTASDGKTQLSYWIESWSSSKAVVWVKVPEIPANSNVTIYMYYGNPKAENAGDPKAVFTFYDDVEAGEDGWKVVSELKGLWHITTHRSHSGSHSWYYGKEGVWNYNVGTTKGYILSPEISLAGHQGALLTFWTWWQHEKYPWGDFDSLDVYVCTGSKCKRVWHRDCNEGPQKANWHLEAIDISSYTGKTIKIKFRFDSKDSLYNNYEGWYVDDIIVRNYVKPEPKVVIGEEETP